MMTMKKKKKNEEEEEPDSKEISLHFIMENFGFAAVT